MKCKYCNNVITRVDLKYTGYRKGKIMRNEDILVNKNDDICMEEIVEITCPVCERVIQREDFGNIIEES